MRDFTRACCMHGSIERLAEVQKGHAKKIVAMHWYELAEGILRADDRRKDEMKGLIAFVLSYLAETSCLVCAENLAMEAVLPCSQMAQSLSLLATRICVGILHGHDIVDRQRWVMILAYHLAAERIHSRMWHVNQTQVSSACLITLLFLF